MSDISTGANDRLHREAAWSQALRVRAGGRSANERRKCLRLGGVLIVSVRDYAVIDRRSPDVRPYPSHIEGGHRFTGEQVWEWDGDQYDLTQRLVKKHLANIRGAMSLHPVLRDHNFSFARAARCRGVRARRARRAPRWRVLPATSYRPCGVTRATRRCRCQARGVAAAAVGLILAAEPPSAAAIVDVRLQLNAIR